MKEVVKCFWKTISEARFDELDNLFCADAQIFLPNTRELFEEPSQYIDFNKAYPGNWRADIEKLFQVDQLVITTVKVKDREGAQSFYVTSYFDFENGKIKKIEEYWGDNTPPPEWRKDGKFTKSY